MKFGGTSLADAQRIAGVCKLVGSRKGDEVVVVVSALAGVTDTLFSQAQKISEGELSEEEIKSFIGELFERHRVVARELLSEKELELVLIELERFSLELEKILIGIRYVGELTPRSTAYVVSFGERLSAPIVSGALNSCGVKSVWFTGYDAGIITDSRYEKASPIWESTMQTVKERLENLLKDSVPVVTGFISGDALGRITTLGRGGSDYTAAIVGAAIDAEEVWIWTDVDGIMTTDPRLVSEAQTIPVISYIEAMELAFFGGKVLHPKSIEPAMEKGVPVRVKNTFNPDGLGTLIVKEQEKAREVVKAVSVMTHATLVTISGVGMIGVPGVAAKTFSALAEEKINILMISQGSSEANISIVIESQDLDKAIKIVTEKFADKDIVRRVDYNNDVAIIAVIGAGMKGTKGVAARLFTSVSKADVNVLMIAQGSSEVNISCVVEEKDAKKAAQALHQEFITKKA
ncbi:bifunctional aspartokinase/homoserine dehydrogenase 1 [archaeon BMS3Abin16]|nr:bifunctional aspartokinase/homoserine dehydrogenase 1 [archaeon BMS3Abin16]